MRKYTLLLNLWLWILSVSGHAQNYYDYYEILDAKEANKLFDALKTDSTDAEGWPLPEGRVSWEEIYKLHVEFARVEWVQLSDSSALQKYKIKRLPLSFAKLAGAIPPVHLDSLESLDLGGNAITGIAAGIQLPKLVSLNLDYCQLKAFPSLDYPELIILQLRNNLIKGPFPVIDIQNLEYLDASENQLSGTVVINCPKMRTLNLRDNQLSGSLLQINCPALENLFLDNNKFKGLLSIPMLPLLKWLDLSGNEFDQIAANFVASIPAIKFLDLAFNHLQFNDLEPLADLNIENFNYSGQYPVPFLIEKEIATQQLTAEVAGNGLQYQWLHVLPRSPLRQINPDSISSYLAVYVYFFNNNIQWADAGVEFLDSIQGNELQISLSDDPRYYACIVSNPKLPELKLPVVTIDYQGTNCWGNAFFTFCFESEEATWESSEDDNEIKATKPLTINNFIHFEGNLTLDTAKLIMKADGKFFIKEIPIPGGGFGSFTVAEGAYELALGGADGKIIGFINDALSRFTPDIGGLALKLEEIALEGGRNADGISMTLEISWDNITPSCGDSGDQTTAIKLKGLKVTRSKGIDVEGMEVSDLGLAPGFCVKELKASYDSENDRLAFGLTLLTPFIEVGGGLALAGGEIDSISMRAVLQDAIILLGATGVGIIGCEGRVSSITNPPFNIRFGGILSAVANDHLFQITTSLEYIPPSELKVEAGDGKFFNPPFYDEDWWLGEGGVYGQIDLSSYRVKVGGEMHLSPYEDDKGEKKFMANGTTELAYRNGVFVGQLEGEVLIPKLGSQWPYDWLNVRFGLPYEIDGTALLVYKSNAKFISGDVNLGDRIGSVHYDINLSRRYDEEGFFSFQANEIKATSLLRSSQDFEINIPDSTPMVVIRIQGYANGSSVWLRDPQGLDYFPFQSSDGNDWDFDDPAKTGFWSIYKPKPGIWNLSVDQVDSVSWYLFENPYTFQITASAEQGGIRVQWDHTMFEPGDSIELYVDTDIESFDGIYVQQVSALGGSHLIPIDLLPNQCFYFVFGISNRNGFIRSAYADEMIDLSNAGLESPLSVSWSYDAIAQELILDWVAPQDPGVAGYVIERWVNDGKQVLGMLYPGVTHFSAVVNAFAPEQIRLVSYGYEGETSCPVYLETSTSIATGGDEPQQLNRFRLFPNPSANRCTIAFEKGAAQTVRIQLVSLMGQVLLDEQVWVHQGTNHLNLDLNQCPAGHYLVRIISDVIMRPEILIVMP